LISTDIAVFRKWRSEEIALNWYNQVWEKNKLRAFKIPKQWYADKVKVQKQIAKSHKAVRKGLLPKEISLVSEAGDDSYGSKATVKQYLYFDGLGCAESVSKQYVPLKMWKPIRRDEDGFPIFPRHLIDSLPITCRGHSSGLKTTARFLGRYPLKVGKRPGKLKRPSILAKLFLSSDYCPSFHR